MESKKELLKNYYENYFEKLCYSGIQSKGSAYIHKKLENYWENTPNSILEVGAGTGEHFDFIRHAKVNKATEYIAVDLNSRKFTRNFDDLDLQLRWLNANVEGLPFKSESFDRCLATCLFLHLDDPFKGFQEIRRVTRNGGEIAIAYPTDPGLLNRTVKKIYTNRKAKKIGLDNVELIGSLEHRNHISGLIKMQNYVFRKDLVQNHFLPFKIHSWNLNILVISHITITK
jgi:ubiquinone/menaquinone biosynthesis C-methylase UbiE